MSLITKTTKHAASVPVLTPGRLFWPLTAWRVGQAARDHWQDRLTLRQRSQFIALLKQSHGRPDQLPKRQQRQFKRLVKALGPFDLVRATTVAALPVAVGRRARTKRGKCAVAS